MVRSTKSVSSMVSAVAVAGHSLPEFCLSTAGTLGNLARWSCALQGTSASVAHRSLYCSVQWALR
eukprot:636645-Lingulodinium_polyedra.AAC.1